jgi:hypothetical protein
LSRCKKNFTKLLSIEDTELRDISGEDKYKMITQESRMQQQMIPNVTRIKIEKIRALRRLQAKHEMVQINLQKKKKSTTNILIFNIDEDNQD